MEVNKIEDYTIYFNKTAYDIMSFPRQTLNIVASRPINGEEVFFHTIIFSRTLRKRHIDFWDLYGDSYSRICGKRIFGDNITAHSAATGVNDLISEIRGIANPDIIILYGIQAIQKNPFSALEMPDIIKKLRAIANDKNAMVIIYSGLPIKCDIKIPTTDDLYEIGINEDDVDTIMFLKRKPSSDY